MPAFLRRTLSLSRSGWQAFGHGVNQRAPHFAAGDLIGGKVELQEAHRTLNVHADWAECRSDALMIENMRMFYDEVRDRLPGLGILSSDEITRQQQLLAALPPESLPAAWGSFGVTAVA